MLLFFRIPGSSGLIHLRNWLRRTTPKMTKKSSSYAIVNPTPPTSISLYRIIARTTLLILEDT
ncbi:hypothetical protein Moror_7867 [Moniliophthora roreri MCA 2997]|uniref:Uncharacterized protein n=1 Tax=Moniliophthora roreri (strain MCA 2997) TaxID=1381753 RepID=V2XB87_MONRO|nr:hypothetical protein Moror_7867 [Moniliophthora roreri MCA 2997]